MDFLFNQMMGTPVWLWIAFLSFILLLMVLDLGVFYRKSHVIGMAESLKLTGFYVSLAMAFAVFMYFWRGSQDAALYITGYVVEQSLSMDNIFVMAVIMNYFAVPRKYQHRVLFYGILGVIIMRGFMIVAGAAVVQRFDWILYLFAAFLVFTGVRMLFHADEDYDVESNPVLKFMRKRFPVTNDFHGRHFLVRLPDPRTGELKLFITPLLLALCVIEVADVIFAVDSIPAIFAITTDPFIIFTSNIFAILGLRALYFALSAMLHRFAYLKYALSLVLIFIGGKFFVADLMGWHHMSPTWSLAITLGLLAGGLVVSLAKTAHENGKERRRLRAQTASAQMQSAQSDNTTQQG